MTTRNQQTYPSSPCLDQHTRDVHRNFEAAFNAGDLEALISLYEPDGCESSITGTGPDGNPLTMSGKTAEVLRRQPDGLCLYIIDSANLGENVEFEGYSSLEARVGHREILSTQGNVATILFEHAGRKTINLSYVKLQPAEGPATHKLGGEISLVANLDINAIRKLCDEWYAEFGESTALHVVSDLRKFRYLTNGTARNLLRSAHQNDNKRVAEIAQAITKAVYGRVLSVQELA